MSSHHAPLSRRTLLLSTTAAAVAATTTTRWTGVAHAADVAPRRSSPGNVRVSTDGFDVHVEPHVAANPRNPRNLLAASIVQRGIRRGLATYASLDAGATWRDNGLLPGLVPAYDADVTVAYDQHGHGFVCGLRSASSDLTNSSILLWRTEDGGHHFTDPVSIHTGTVDHPWLTASRSPQAPGNLYVAWADGPRLSNGLAFIRSMDGGRTFQPPQFLDPQGRIPMAASGPDGAVHVIYQVSRPDDGWSVNVTTSTDHGHRFHPPVTLAQVSPPDHAPAGFVVNPKSTPTLAVAPDGRVYAAFPYYDLATGQFQLRICASSDRGRHWSSTVAVGSTNTVYLQPMVAVNDTGHAAVSVLAVAGNQVQVLLLTSEAGTGGYRQRIITSRPFDATNAESNGGEYYLGDHQGLAAARDAFHAVWNDTRTGRMELFTAAVCPGTTSSPHTPVR